MHNVSSLSIGAVLAAIAAFFGGWSLAMQTLIIFMAIDYITGIIVAAVFRKSQKTSTGGMSSIIGWKGLAKKGGTLCVVFIAFKLDQLLGLTYIQDMVIIAYVVNELVSIIENVGLMGVPIPAVITKSIDLLKHKSETEENSHDSYN